MKKVFSLLLALVLIVGLMSGCSGSSSSGTTGTSTSSGSSTAAQSDSTTQQQEPATEPVEEADSQEPSADGLPAMTTEDITLTYAYWGQHEKGEPEVTQAQMQAFMEEYPNITVEFLQIEQSEWDATLTNLASTGQLPDVFGVFSVSSAVMNEWAYPLDEFYEKEPDIGEMFPAFAENIKIGGTRYSVPWVMFPHLVLVNTNLFELYNEPLPSYTWSVDDYFEIGKRISHPEDFNFGLSNPIYEDLFPAWYNGSQGKWGWDGERYNFDQAWIDALNTKFELIDSGTIEWESEADKEKWLGDPTAWPPGWGRTALHIDWPWTIAHFEEVWSAQSGCEWLYYPLPMTDNNSQLVIVDNAIVGANTKYPREAWELLKWTTWGEEANLIRQQAYRDAGANISRMPVTSNAKVWQDLIDNAQRDDFKNMFTVLRDANLVPSNWPVAPGWGSIEAWMNEQDIYGRIDRREISPADVAAELDQKANELAQEWINNIP